MTNETIKLACELLQNAGFKAFLVGGSVRDMLLGIEAHDIDITTDAKPCQIKTVFSFFKQFNLGEKFGTITVLINNEFVEITTFRSESDFSLKRNELNITFETELSEDLKRRDLTVNAMAFNPCNGELIDLFGGKADLDNHIIRFVGVPSERIREDPLRKLRAIRFTSKLNSVIEPNSLKAIRDNAHLIMNVSFERIRDELLKILSIKDCSFSLEFLFNTGILDQILPELAILKRVEQPKKWHKWNVLTHSFQTVLNIPSDKPLLRLAGLLHDLGKTECRDCSPFFPNHEIKGTEIFKTMAKRLKLSVADTQFISFMISTHMSQFGFKNIVNNKSAQKRFLSKMGENIKFLDDLFILFEADKLATGREDPLTTFTTNLMHKQFKEILANKEPLQVKDLNIKGTDLINLGLPINSTLSFTLKMLLDAVINGEIENTKEALINKTKSLISFGVIKI